MKLIKNLSVTRKLTLVCFLSAGVALLIVATALCAFHIYTFRQNFVADVQTTARIVGYNCAAVLVFKDRSAATEMLGALRAKPHMVEAALQPIDAPALATFSTSPGYEWDDYPRTDGVRFLRGHVLCTHVIELDGKRVGYLYLRSDYQRVYHAVVPLYIGLIAVALSVAVVVVVIVSQRLHRFITMPIERLAETARIVATRRDYSVRAATTSTDEIGVLTQAFNQMLSQIQSQDAALNESARRYQILFHENPMPMWVHDSETMGFLAVNHAMTETYGYTREEFLARSVWALHAPEDIEATRAYLKRRGSKADHGVLRHHRTRSGATIEVETTSHELRLDDMTVRLVLANDVTERRKAEQELNAAQQRLVQASRLAGMAEVATGVLHNVGNVLNSVNVSASLALDRTTRLKTENLGRCMDMITQHRVGLADFFTNDPKGKVLPDYLVRLSAQLAKDQQSLVDELKSLARNVEHIKEIIAVQQSHARVVGCREPVDLAALLDDAVRINAASLDRHQINLLRDYQKVPAVMTDRHKVLQILVNLISNAKAAVLEKPPGERAISLTIDSQDSSGVAIAVTDSGIGIKPENLIRIFQHGFTTKKNGHGFGLHSGAIAAREMGGALHVSSDGPGCGATFTLTIPFSRPNESKEKIA